MGVDGQTSVECLLSDKRGAQPFDDEYFLPRMAVPETPPPSSQQDEDKMSAEEEQPLNVESCDEPADVSEDEVQSISKDELTGEVGCLNQEKTPLDATGEDEGEMYVSGYEEEGEQDVEIKQELEEEELGERR